MDSFPPVVLLDRFSRVNRQTAGPHIYAALSDTAKAVLSRETVEFNMTLYSGRWIMQRYSTQTLRQLANFRPWHVVQ